ncbi:hypothetical protein E8803_RS23180 [Escherichia coli]|nr:hypothetical protein [Escherichia coli]
MNQQCPACYAHAKVERGRFRDLTNLKFDTEYNDGVFGMTDGVRVHCPKCGKYGLYFDDFQKIQQGKIKPQAISDFKKAYPGWRGIISLPCHLDSKQSKSSFETP